MARGCGCGQLADSNNDSNCNEFFHALSTWPPNCPSYARSCRILGQLYWGFSCDRCSVAVGYVYGDNNGSCNEFSYIFPTRQHYRLCYAVSCTKCSSAGPTITLLQCLLLMASWSPSASTAAAHLSCAFAVLKVGRWGRSSWNLCDYSSLTGMEIKGQGL